MQKPNLYQFFLENYISPCLITKQFVRRGSRFYRDWGETIGLIEFQKSRKSTKDATLFTINLGIFSKTIANFFGNKKREMNFSRDECHWKERLGFLMKERRDMWWVLNLETSLEIIGKEMCDLLTDLAIPALEQFKEEKSLYNFWKSGKYGGLTDFEQLVNLSILAMKFGEKEQIDRVVKHLKQFEENSSLQNAAARQLQKLKLEKES
jgi:hypothetical protein